MFRVIPVKKCSNFDNEIQLVRLNDTRRIEDEGKSEISLSTIIP